MKVATLVDHLFRTRLHPDGREYTHREVAAALDQRLTPSHLGKLRSGQIDNPKRDTIILLCQFFQVPASFFFPELEPETPITDTLRNFPPEVQEVLGAFLLALGHVWPTSPAPPQVALPEAQEGGE